MKIINHIKSSFQFNNVSGLLKLPHFGNTSMTLSGNTDFTVMTIPTGSELILHERHSNNQAPMLSATIRTMTNPLLGTTIVSFLGGFNKFLKKLIKKPVIL